MHLAFLLRDFQLQYIFEYRHVGGMNWRMQTYQYNTRMRLEKLRTKGLSLVAHLQTLKRPPASQERYLPLKRLGNYSL